MPIFKLIPIDKKSDHWRASAYNGYVIVRDDNPNEARAIAASEFGIPPTRVHGGKTLHIPWTRSDLVSCQRLENSNYEETGPAAVLYPET